MRAATAISGCAPPSSQSASSSASMSACNAWAAVSQPLAVSDAASTLRSCRVCGDCSGPRCSAWAKAITASTTWAQLPPWRQSQRAWAIEPLAKKRTLHIGSCALGGLAAPAHG
ncbi:hypothetical protein D3C72_2010430 [compost metagenome]